MPSEPRGNQYLSTSPLQRVGCIRVNFVRLFAQVHSMWEDTFTGVFKFRAVLLIRVEDLPAEAVARLTESRLANASRKKRRSAGDKKSSVKKSSEHDNSGSDQDVKDGGGVSRKNEVFITDKTEDFEVNAITRPVILSVTEVDADAKIINDAVSSQLSRKGKNVRTTGDSRPRLTHAYSHSTEDFSELGSMDAILVRARIRRAQESTASDMDDEDSGKEHLREETTTSKNNSKGGSEGWLRQKVTPNVATRGRGRGRGRATSGGAGRGGSSSGRGMTRTGSQSYSTSDQDEEVSGDSDEEVEPDPNDEPWEEGEDGMTDSDTDAELVGGSRNVGSNAKRASSLSSTRAAAADNANTNAGSAGTETDEDDPRATRKAPRYRRTQRSPAPNTQTQSTLTNTKQELESSKQKAPDPEVAANSHAHSQRRPRAPASRRHGPLPTRPRRLAMPPGPALPEAPGDGSSSVADATVSAPAIASRTRPMRTRLASGAKGRGPTSEEASSSIADSVSGKRKRNGSGKASALGQSDYPPLRTPVGKEYQAEIPDLLPKEQRDRSPSVGNGTRMVS